MSLSVSYAALAARQPAAGEGGAALLALLKSSMSGDLFALEERELATSDQWNAIIIKRGAGGTWTLYDTVGKPVPGECDLDETDEDKCIESEWNLFYRAPDGIGHAGRDLLTLVPGADFDTGRLDDDAENGDEDYGGLEGGEASAAGDDISIPNSDFASDGHSDSLAGSDGAPSECGDDVDSEPETSESEGSGNSAGDFDDGESSASHDADSRRNDEEKDDSGGNSDGGDDPISGEPASDSAAVGAERSPVGSGAEDPLGGQRANPELGRHAATHKLISALEACRNGVTPADGTRVDGVLVCCIDPGTKEHYERATSGTIFTKERDCSIDTIDIYIASDLGRGVGAFSKMCKEELIERLRNNKHKLTVLPPELDKVTAPNRAAGLGWNGGNSPAAVLIGGGSSTDLHPTQGWRYFLCYSPVDPSAMPIGYGAAVTSAVTGEGWCAGIFSASKVAGSTKTFVAVFSLAKVLAVVPVRHVERRTIAADQPSAADAAMMAEMQAALRGATTLKTASAYYSASHRAIKAVEQLSTPIVICEDTSFGGSSAAPTRRSSQQSSFAFEESHGGGGDVPPWIDPASDASSLSVTKLRALITQLGHTVPSRLPRKGLLAKLVSIRDRAAGLAVQGGGGRGGGGRGRGDAGRGGGGGGRGRGGKGGGRGDGGRARGNGGGGVGLNGALLGNGGGVGGKGRGALGNGGGGGSDNDALGNGWGDGSGGNDALSNGGSGGGGNGALGGNGGGIGALGKGGGGSGNGLVGNSGGNGALGHGGGGGSGGNGALLGHGGGGGGCGNGALGNFGGGGGGGNGDFGNGGHSGAFGKGGDGGGGCNGPLGNGRDKYGALGNGDGDGRARAGGVSNSNGTLGNGIGGGRGGGGVQNGSLGNGNCGGGGGGGRGGGALGNGGGGGGCGGGGVLGNGGDCGGNGALRHGTGDGRGRNGNDNGANIGAVGDDERRARHLLSFFQGDQQELAGPSSLMSQSPDTSH